MVINTNLQAQINSDNLQATQARLSKSLNRLSSGSKLTAPSDDAGGLSVATKLDAQVKRTDAATNNIASAVSFTQTQDGYLQSITNALNRMSELSMLSQDVTKTDSDRSDYNLEYVQLSNYITTAASKDFNGVSLFSANSLAVTVDSEGSTFTMTGIDLSIAAYSNATGANIATTTAAIAALGDIKTAINQLSSDRAKIGSFQTRLNYTSQQLTVSKQNLAAATSQIKDVDVADESTEFAKENVLIQSGTAMLAQANQMPQSVLKLLQ
jgi:flagellin